ncbi:WLM domain-containing protein [Chaetomium sp. MPI-SDFR-AT-0129]|nr:WLM domain-containing protein [Chaetomium sp. MPI-SDFR-AT-0129]
MPLNILRLNAKKSQPNDRIVFIKPLKGPDEATAQDFLERIAAQCLPIMKEHSLSVTSLEEYEPNPEFVGRNFNAGEVIQLVLKARSGHWLPFNYVQMVMMHELAHCKQMNHSRAFWKVRNLYAEQMRGLWTRGYTGEGLWGRGALLSTGEFERNTAGADEPLPEHLCGGTYRSRSRKRKASNKKTLTYQEQKQRRILKKFGANGVTLGDDPITKRKLEKGKTITGKPRVAGSARGRELRAAAALARFDQQKQETQESEDLEEGSESDGDEDEDDTDSGPVAVDAHGNKLLDSKGRDMVKVCEDENPNGQDAQDELAELQRFSLASWLSSGSTGTGQQVKDEPGASAQPSTKPPDAKPIPSAPKVSKPLPPASTPHPPRETKPPPPSTIPSPPPTSSSFPPPHACPLCTFLNEPTATTCAMCSNTLALPGARGAQGVGDTRSLEGTWACQSRICAGAGARQGAAAAGYRNAADCGVCGVCGERRRGADI